MPQRDYAALPAGFKIDSAPAALPAGFKLDSAQISKPVPSMGPGPTGVKAWLEDLENDVKQGGTRTAPGRILGHMQGRGDKGYSGTESGTTQAVSDFVASLPLGAIKTARGVADTPSHPVRGPLKAIGGILQASTMPTAFMGGPAAYKAVEAIPSAKWAGKMLESVAQDAGAVPVNLSRSGNEILRVKELADAGTSMPQSISKLLQRVTKPGSAPLNYSEARDFYSNITRLSANEVGRLNPTMQRQLSIVTRALREDIGDAASQVNRAGDYYAALKDYAHAYQLKRAAVMIGKQVGIPLAKLAAAGAAAKAGWDVFGKYAHTISGRP